MRLSTFWELMTAQFGETYARSVAKDHVFAQLGGRTAEQALAEGIAAQRVWRAVCEAYEVPERLRLRTEDPGAPRLPAPRLPAPATHGPRPAARIPAFHPKRTR